MFNITETPGTTIYVNSESSGELKLVQVALGQSGTDLPDQSGNNGRVLGTDGTDLSWVDPSGLPEQSGNAGKVLGTDGNNTSWVAQTGGGSSLPDTSGHSNEILSNDGADLDWRGIDSFLPDQSGHSNEVLITVGGVLSWVPIDALPEQSGKNGYYLTTDGADPYWAPIDALPSQSGNSGNILTTNGSTPSWITPDTIDELLPSQSAQSGEFLTTNGVNSSWSAIPTELPAQSGNSGKYLTTDGSAASWATVSSGDSLPSQSGNSGKKLTTDGSNPSWTIDNLDSLSDVVVDTPVVNQVIVYDGSNWVNSNVSGVSWNAYTATDAALPVGGSLTVTHPSDSALKRVVQGLVMSTPSTPTYWWKLDDTSGTTAYAEIGGSNLTLVGSPTLGAGGQFGTSIGFSGSSQYAHTQLSFAEVTSFTVDMWIYPTSVTGTQSIWGAAASLVSSAAFVACHRVGTALSYYFGGGWNLSGGTLAINTWHHITCTWDGSVVRSYLNGVFVSSYTSSGTNQATASTFMFGETGNVFYTGRVDNPMVFINSSLPVEAISDTETYSYGGSWQPMQLGTADGQITVSYASDTTTIFTSNLANTKQVKVEVLL